METSDRAHTPVRWRNSNPEYFTPRGDFSQTMIDIGAILAGFLLVSATGIGLAAALFILLFVRL